MSIKCLTAFVQDFTNHFFKLFKSEHNSQGIRMQQTEYVVDYEGQKFTITIERGDKLNGLESETMNKDKIGGSI